MTPSRLEGFRGTVRAAGFVLDVALLGQAQARARVLRLWAAGASLRALPDGRWLLLLATPVSARAERAPGLVVGSRDGVLLAAGADHGGAAAGELVEVRHGDRVRYVVATLPAIDPAAWIDVGERRAVSLTALDAVPAPTPVIPSTAVDVPDLRGLAKVLARSDRTLKLVQERDRAPAGGGAARGAPGRGLLARLALRTPVAGMVGRRHSAYLQRLTRAFETGDYENALRDAIGLGGSGDGIGWLTLRLPSRRRGVLTPAARARRGGVVPWGGSAHEHLSQLYRRAADQLEQAGEIERAAFVHADLLHAPRDAVALLERHGRLELAARLAEGRELDADLVVRLWWQAGDRDRAIDIARARGAWATAVARLQEVRPQSALAMRVAWVAAEQQAGNHLGAVEAAWPEPILRPHVGDDLAVLRSEGGPGSARALALQLAWRSDDRWTAEALALLDARDVALTAHRLAFATALTNAPAADPVTDRRLAGQALRALMRDAGSAGAASGQPARALVHGLRTRADPLLGADMPSFHPSPPPLAVALVNAPSEPGTLAVSDAVTLPGGVLVATGERGLLLLSHDGRAKARWSIHADRLIVADHGATVLVAGHGDAVDEVHRLDVGSRQIRRWASLPATPLLQSFDGGILTLVETQRITGIDTLGDRPRELWRELDPDSHVLDASRSPRWMSAILDVPLRGRRGERSIERWTWELPSRRLHARELTGDDWPISDSQTTADGMLLSFTADDLGLTEHRMSADRERSTARAPAGAHVQVSGEHSALVEPGEDEMRIWLRSTPRHDVVAVVGFVGSAPPRFRVHAGVVTIWAPDGRIVAVDLAGRTTVALLRVLA